MPTPVLSLAHFFGLAAGVGDDSQDKACVEEQQPFPAVKHQIVDGVRSAVDQRSCPLGFLLVRHDLNDLAKLDAQEGSVSVDRTDALDES